MVEIAYTQSKRAIRVIVKRFPTERAAQLYAWQFAYARRVSRLAPLTIVPSGDQWGEQRDDLGVDHPRRVVVGLHPDLGWAIQVKAVIPNVAHAVMLSIASPRDHVRQAGALA
jgi:hypothetical protein